MCLFETNAISVIATYYDTLDRVILYLEKMKMSNMNHNYIYFYTTYNFKPNRK